MLKCFELMLMRPGGRCHQWPVSAPGGGDTRCTDITLARTEDCTPVQAAVIPTHSHNVVNKMHFPSKCPRLSYKLSFVFVQHTLYNLAINTDMISHTPSLWQPLEGFVFTEGRGKAAAWAGESRPQCLIRLIIRPGIRSSEG